MLWPSQNESVGERRIVDVLISIFPGGRHVLQPLQEEEEESGGGGGEAAHQGGGLAPLPRQAGGGGQLLLSLRQGGGARHLHLSHLCRKS